MRRWNAVRVRVDEQLVGSTIDLVVQRRLVQAGPNVLQPDQRSVERHGISDLGWHGIADAFLLAALCGGSAAWVAERDPDRGTCGALVGEDAQNPRVLRKEQRAIGQDADLPLG